MTDQEKLKLKLNIIQEFKKLHFTCIEVYEIFDDLKREVSNLAIEQELKKLKFRRK